jgi:hypothetical protein
VVAYRLLFKTVGQLLPAGHKRTQHAKKLFRLYVEDRCLGEVTYRRLRGAVGPELLLTLIGGRGYARLLPGWTARVGKSATSKLPRTPRPRRGTSEGFEKYKARPQYDAVGELDAHPSFVMPSPE